MPRVRIHTFLPIFWAFLLGGILSLLLNSLPFASLQTQRWFISLIFLVVLYSASTILVQLPANNKDQSQKILALSIGRLLVALVFILIYILLNKTNAKSFSIHFIFHFIIFLTFDTYYLIKKVIKT